MSVINNVLRDLENRESRFTPIDIAPVAAPAAAGPRVTPVLLILPLLLLGIAGGWIYLQPYSLSGETAAAAPPGPAAQALAPKAAAALQPDNARMTDPRARGEKPAAAASAAMDAEPPRNSPVPAAATEPAIPPAEIAERAGGNQIIGLQLRESEDEMQMSFVLRERVVAYPKERGHDHFSYHLRGVDSQIVAPRMRDNRWLESLEISTAGSGVDIDFTTAPGILVETRQGRLDGEPTWSISLRQASLAPAPASRPETDAPAAAASKPAAGPGAVGADAVSAPPAESEPLPVKLEIRTSRGNAKSINQLEYAVELIKSRRAADAEALLKELLDGPEDRRARQRLLALYDREQQYQRFQLLVTESIRRYPQDALFQTGYARTLFRNGAYRDAIELLAAQPRLDANQLALVAASYQRLELHADAVRHYRLALAQDAASARNWIALGISLEHSAALADALQSYQRAAALGGLEPELQAFVKLRSNALKQVMD